MYMSVVVICRRLCYYYHYLIQEHFVWPTRNATSISSYSPFSPPPSHQQTVVIFNG